MAYAAFSVVFGEQPSAAKWNILGSNDASFNDGTGIANLATSTTSISNPYKFSAYRATAWTTSNSFALVQFDTENFDTNNNFDVTTNKGRYTAPVAGFYLFSACTGESTGTGIHSISIYKNGVKKQQGQNVNVGAASTLSTVTALVQCAASDYIEIYNIGGSGSTGYTGQDLCWFTGFLVSQT
jgi:hypothetical protein